MSLEYESIAEVEDDDLYGGTDQATLEKMPAHRSSHTVGYGYVNMHAAGSESARGTHYLERSGELEAFVLSGKAKIGPFQGTDKRDDDTGLDTMFRHHVLKRKSEVVARF